jgi:hypothetical protein
VGPISRLMRGATKTKDLTSPSSSSKEPFYLSDHPAGAGLALALMHRLKPHCSWDLETAIDPVTEGGGAWIADDAVAHLVQHIANTDRCLGVGAAKRPAPAVPTLEPKPC